MSRLIIRSQISTKLRHFFPFAGHWSPSKAIYPSSSSSSRPVPAQESCQWMWLLLPFSWPAHNQLPWRRELHSLASRTTAQTTQEVPCQMSPEPVKMQLHILWPGEAESVKIVNFDLVSLYLKVPIQRSIFHFNMGYFRL